MTITLKQKYTLKKLNETKRRVKTSELTLREGIADYNASLLLEALDADEYKKATQVIEKLQGISSEAEKVGLKQIPEAIDNCIKEINEFTGGGIMQRAKSKLSSLASLFSKEAPAKNPIVKGLSFASALENGFKSVSVVLKNNIKDIQKKMDTTIIDSIGDDEKIKKNISNTLLKAFVPTGTFGKIFGKIPYIKDTNAMIEELMTLTPKSLGEMFKPINAGPQASEMDAEITDQDANKEASEELKDKTDGNDNKQKAERIKTTQNAAKKAGIKDGKSLVALMRKLGYETGSDESALVVPVLQELMAEKNIPDDQADGFIRGLMADFDKDFKDQLEQKIEKQLEDAKKKLADKQSKMSGKTAEKSASPAASEAN